MQRQRSIFLQAVEIWRRIKGISCFIQFPVEEKAYKQIEDGLERKMNDNQNIELIDQERKETVKVFFFLIFSMEK